MSNPVSRETVHKVASTIVKEQRRLGNSSYTHEQATRLVARQANRMNRRDNRG